MAKPKRDEAKAEDAPAPEGGAEVETKTAPAEGQETPDELREQRDEYLARWQRAQADYQNLRRRSSENVDSALRHALMPLLEGLLLVLDHLDMALSAPVQTEDAKNLALGVRLTRDQFQRALEQEGVEPIEETGVFDPKLHEAVCAVEDPDGEPGRIVETVRRGYRWRGHVLRYAHVKVSKLPATQADEPSAAPAPDEEA
jgi:molecular chaperone GrpE